MFVIELKLWLIKFDQLAILNLEGPNPTIFLSVANNEPVYIHVVLIAIIPDSSLE